MNFKYSKSIVGYAVSVFTFKMMIKLQCIKKRLNVAYGPLSVEQL
jgi:hypothetical protein